MVLEPSIVELSSSDDEEEGHSQGRNRWPGPPGTEPDYFKFGNVGVEDDDVMIIDKPNNTGTAKRDKARPIRTVMDDDDECRMLDTDPGATETTDTTDTVSSYDSGDLIMTGEKGPVACRDFPHGRYLCVHYPFKTTPHAKFCAQCHCYVCDSLAPCTQWGDGNSSHDHCHATEEPRWKTLRKLAKCGLLPSRALPSTAVPAAPTAAPVSNINRMGSATAVTSFVHSGALLDASSTSPTSLLVFSHSAPGHPVGSGVSRQVQGISSTVKNGPLIIKLKGKARGKPSQLPHLGVRTPRYVPRNRSTLPSPRSAPAPSGRSRDEVSPPGVQPSQPPQFTPNPNPGPGRAGSGTAAEMPPHQSQPVPAFRTAPGRAGGAAVRSPPVQFSLPNVAPYFSAPPPPPPNNPPSVDFSRTTVCTNVAPRYHPASAPDPPLPNSPPPYIPPPPSGAYNHSVSGGYDYPRPDVFDQRLPGGADATVAGFVPTDSHIPDSRYVPISALSTQQISCNVNTDPFYEGHSNGQPYNYLAEGYRSAVDSAHHPSSSYISSNGGNADILAGATEGWVEDVTAHFDSFGSGIIGAAPDHDQQAASSLSDVLEQMAGDDYLWEQFPSW